MPVETKPLYDYEDSEIEKMISEIVQGIRELSVEELGQLFDELYTKLDKSYAAYLYVVEAAIHNIEWDTSVTTEEAEMLDEKMWSVCTMIERPRSFSEVPDEEFNDLSNAFHHLFQWSKIDEEIDAAFLRLLSKPRVAPVDDERI